MKLSDLLKQAHAAMAVPAGKLSVMIAKEESDLECLRECLLGLREAERRVAAVVKHLEAKSG